MATLYVRKGRKHWLITEQTFVNKTRLQKTIPRAAYQALGINPEASYEETKQTVKRLNKQNSIQRKEATKISAAARRIIDIKESEHAFLPPEYCADFTERIREDSFGTEYHIERLYFRWAKVQKMIIALKLKPSQYFDRKKAIYKYFVAEKLSIDYTNKCLKILNEWGYFYSAKTSSLFRPVPPPRGVQREALAKAYKTKENHRRPSEPITPEMLADKRTKLKPSYYNWIYISLWFGLRPEEIDSLKENSRITTQDKTIILNVYQTKLVTLEEEDRWKLIPCLHPEQLKALELIKTGFYKRPTPKAMKVFGSGVGVYGGRKGFELLMRDHGHNIEHIASWLGHQSIETTWEKYRNRRVASF